MAGTRLNSSGQVLVGVQRHHPDRSVAHRHVEVLALSGAITAQQGGHRRQCGMHPARGDVGDRGAGQSGDAVGVAAAAMHIARHGQIVEVVSGPIPARARLAVAARRAVDDPLVDGPNGLVFDAEAVDHPGPEALDDYIGATGQRQERVSPVIGLEVEQRTAHAAVTAVGVRGRNNCHPGVPGRRTHFDDVRAVVGQQAGGPGRGAHGGQVEHSDSFERSRTGSGHALCRHGLTREGSWGIRSSVAMGMSQKFLGSPRPRRAMMFFWISEAPPPMVSITVKR